MVTTPKDIPRDNTQIRDATYRPLCDPQQQASQPFLLPLSSQGGGGNGRSHGRLAPVSALCIPTHSSASQGSKENPEVRGGGNFDSPSLAQEAMVFQHNSTVNKPPFHSTHFSRPSFTGPDTPSRPRMVEFDRMEIERRALEERGLNSEITDTILSSRRESTKRLYNITWKAFVRWCRRKKRFYMRPSLNDILEFLQENVRQGLRPNTLRWQTTAIATVVQQVEGYLLTRNPLVVRFLKGATVKAPPQVHRFPSWNLNIVLQTLTRTPFKPIRSIPIRMLALKTIFLVAITSARRVSELGALSVRADLCVFHKDMVVLCTDPTFQPKRDPVFYMSQEICLPTFFRNARNKRELRWHKLVVRRTLRTYIRRTEPLRKTDCLFINVQ